MTTIFQIAEGNEWYCWDCGRKYYFTEPIKINGLEYCPDCAEESITNMESIIESHNRSVIEREYNNHE